MGRSPYCDAAFLMERSPRSSCRSGRGGHWVGTEDGRAGNIELSIFHRTTTTDACHLAGQVMSQATATAIGCPFAHDAPAVQRSQADIIVRRLLRIRERPSGVSARQAVNAFRRSMIISTVRCTLTYVVFPFVLPALGLVTDTGVAISIVIGTLAITCDIFSIRRFFVADHKWRWPLLDSRLQRRLPAWDPARQRRRPHGRLTPPVRAITWPQRRGSPPRSNQRSARRHAGCPEGWVDGRPPEGRPRSEVRYSS